MKTLWGLFLTSLFIFSLAAAEGPVDNTRQVTGIIEKIAEDQTYIMIDSVKVFIDPELLEEAYFQEGDKVKVTAEQTDRGLEVRDYEYLFADQEDSNLTEEQLERIPLEPGS